MMFEEIEKFMQSAESSLTYRIVNLGGRSVYLEGIRSLVNIGENEIIFQLKSCAISVLGSNLRIKYLDKSTCVVEGTIVGVNLK